MLLMTVVPAGSVRLMDLEDGSMVADLDRRAPLQFGGGQVTVCTVVVFKEHSTGRDRIGAG
jgi:hypothetical protein